LWPVASIVKYIFIYISLGTRSVQYCTQIKAGRYICFIICNNNTAYLERDGTLLREEVEPFFIII
jgi:hypothetical protein